MCALANLVPVPVGLAAAAVALAPAPALGADLATFGYGNARLGSTTATTITARSAPRMLHAWRTDVGGAVNTQALKVGRLLLVGEEHGSVVALVAATGRVAWRRQLGTRTVPDCGSSPDDVYGVTGTLVADRKAGRVYAVDARGRAWALRLRDGHPVAGWPVTIHRPGPEFVWSALSLSGGRLYVPIASICDNGGDYQGGIVAIDTASRRVTRWATTAGTGTYAGGIWGWGGVSIDAGGDVFAATGNALGGADEAAGYAERVVRLSAGLAVKASHNPLIAPFEVGDRDFGTTPLLLDAPGCGHQLVALNKIGELYLYDRDNLAAGPQQRLRVARELGVPLYGVPAYDPATRTLVFTTPSTPAGRTRFHQGLQALTLTARCRLTPRWQASFPSGAGSAPMIAGGVVYIGAGLDPYLCAYRLSDGKRLWTGTLSRAGVMAAPTVLGNTVYASDWSGGVWAFRPGG